MIYINLKYNMNNNYSNQNNINMKEDLSDHTQTNFQSKIISMEDDYDDDNNDKRKEENTFYFKPKKR